MTDYLKFHEIESIYFRPASSRAWPELAECLKGEGFTFEGDVFYKVRTGRIPPWQHKMIAEVRIFLDGVEVYGRGSRWDLLRIDYLFAYLPAECIEDFMRIVGSVANRLGLRPELNGAIVSSGDLRAAFDNFARDLMCELAEEPGTEALAAYLASTYPRFKPT